MLVLVAGLEADEVHATFATVVPGVEPIPLGTGESRVVALPREPVVVVTVTLGSGAVQTVLAEETVGEAKLAGAVTGVTTAITGEKLVFAGCLR